MFSFLSLCSDGVVEEVLVGELYTLFELGAVGPAEGCSFAHIEQFAGCAVRTRGVPEYLSVVTHYLCYELRELTYGERG